jgi:Glycogen recognition site of AMP-activated protein kinase
MPDQMNDPALRLNAALDAMRVSPVIERDAATHIAARAVLANAPKVRARAWSVGVAAAIVVVAIGATALATSRQTAAPAAPAMSAALSESAVQPTVALPVSNIGARPIVFELDAPNARSVQVLGDFNQWSRRGNAMQRGTDGRWRTTALLTPGRYIYAYLVDGQRFRSDPTRDAVEDHDFGVTGSELVVGDPP